MKAKLYIKVAIKDPETKQDYKVEAKDGAMPYNVAALMNLKIKAQT